MAPRKLKLARWIDQQAGWPRSGRPLLAQHDDEEVVLYQAFNREIAAGALERQRLDVPGFGLGRMSWVKPSFLWMMYRCGWATKDENQQRVLAIWVRRSDLETLLGGAVVTPYDAGRHGSKAAWADAVASSEVRVQWDPDRTPRGDCDGARRAIQVGLRGAALRDFATTLIREIQDVTPLVEAQRALLGHPELLVPEQRVMPLRNSIASARSEADPA